MPIVEAKIGDAFDAETDFGGTFVEAFIGDARNARIGNPWTRSSIMPIVFIDEDSAYASESIEGFPFVISTEADLAVWTEDYNAWQGFLAEIEALRLASHICFFHVETFLPAFGGWRQIPIRPTIQPGSDNFNEITNWVSLQRCAVLSPEFQEIVLQRMKDHTLSVIDTVRRSIARSRWDVVTIPIFVDNSGSMTTADLEPCLSEWMDWLNALTFREIRVVIGDMFLDEEFISDQSGERWLFQLLKRIRLLQEQEEQESP